VSVTPAVVGTMVRLAVRKIGSAAVRRTFFAQALELMRKDIQDNFKNSRSPDGTPWPRLKWRRADGTSKPLMHTLLLYRSATQKGAPGHFEKATDRVAEIGTSLPQARLHQYGGVVRPKKAKFLAFRGPGGKTIFAKAAKIPARPFLGASPALTRKLCALLVKTIESGPAD
jgi:phage gpG-like protein